MKIQPNSNSEPTWTIKAGLNEGLAGLWGDHGLEFSGSEGVDVSRFGRHQQHHLGSRQGGDWRVRRPAGERGNKFRKKGEEISCGVDWIRYKGKINQIIYKKITYIRIRVFDS